MFQITEQQSGFPVLHSAIAHGSGRRPEGSRSSTAGLVSGAPLLPCHLHFYGQAADGFVCPAYSESSILATTLPFLTVRTLYSMVRLTVVIERLFYTS